MQAIETFLDENGKIIQLPAKGEKKREVLLYLAEKFSYNRDYTEKEVNSIIDHWHTFGDYFLLRRELIDSHFLSRTWDGKKYWKESSLD